MTAAPSTLPILDHFVVLVSYQTLQELPKRLENSLTVIEGGKHADGLTLNKLIILPDGTYIELIAFWEDVDPEHRKKHMWGSLEEGEISDWAYTLLDQKDFPQIQERVQEAATASRVMYQDPISNGRLRSDGVELKWALSSAQDASQNPLWPGTAPFWCLDHTPRNLRVPYSQRATGAAPPYTVHPSGAQGVSRVSVSVPEKDFLTVSQVYEGVHGPAVEEGRGKKVWSWSNHAGSWRGKQQVALVASSDQKRRISLTLAGGSNSPQSIQVLPGLEFDFDLE